MLLCSGASRLALGQCQLFPAGLIWPPQNTALAGSWCIARGRLPRMTLPKRVGRNFLLCILMLRPTPPPPLRFPLSIIAGVAQGDVDYWEINEAFSVVDLVNRRLLKLDAER